MQKYSKFLWQENAAIFDKIIAHPFNQEMADGSLSIEKFYYYIEQDALYLRDFVRAISLIAARCDNVELIENFLEFARAALIAEREVVHKFYIDHENYQPTNKISPAYFAYSNFLLRTCALAPIEVAIASILPCFWIYMSVGKYIFAHEKNNINLYQKWIDTYSCPKFAESVSLAISILDSAADAASISIRKQMSESFKHSFLLEYYFWNDAYNMKYFE